MGRFLDGTPWVRHPSGGNVTITSAKPDSSRTGLEKNPATGAKVPAPSSANNTIQQGLWSGSQGGTQYVATLDLSTQLPYNAPPDDGVYVKADEYLGVCGYTGAAEPDCINAYSTLTVLKNLPPDSKNGKETFRPSMSGAAKRIFTLKDLDLSRLVSYSQITLGSVLPSYASVANSYLNGPILNLYTTGNGDKTREWVPRASGQDDYAAYRAMQMNLAIYKTLDGGALSEEKKRAVYGIVQAGIDVYGAFREGVTFMGGAGQHQGAWAPLVYLGALTTDATVRQNIRSATKPTAWNDASANVQFIELYQVRPSRTGEPIWGSEPGDDGCRGGAWNGLGRYWSDYAAYQLRGVWQKKTCGDPYGYIDGPAERPGAQYFVVTGGVYVSIALLQKIWPQFDYVANNPVMKRFGERLMNGAGYWTQPDQCAAVDPREPATCSPYTSAATCTYFGKTWGVDVQGGALDQCVTTAQAAARGHPKPVSRFADSHLRGRPPCGNSGIGHEKPGCQLWDALSKAAP